jgi:hypothetical protein
MFGQTEPVTVPSKKFSLHVSSAQPRLGSRCLSATQWALTFPNLRRHHTNIFFCILTLVMLTCKKHVSITSRFVPSAKEFLCVMCSFSTANNLSISIKRSTTERRSICYVCSYFSDAFSTAVLLNWPANLKCWIVLPVVLVVPCAICRNRQL